MITLLLWLLCFCNYKIICVQGIVLNMRLLCLSLVRYPGAFNVGLLLLYTWKFSLIWNFNFLRESSGKSLIKLVYHGQLQVLCSYTKVNFKSLVILVILNKIFITLKSFTNE